MNWPHLASLFVQGFWGAIYAYALYDWAVDE